MTDHTEMQIPDDVRVALAKEYVRQNFESGEPWSMTISRAILQERERCAKIAENLYPMSDYGDEAKKKARFNIASIIRNE